MNLTWSSHMDPRNGKSHHKDSDLLLLFLCLLSSVGTWFHYISLRIVLSHLISFLLFQRKWEILCSQNGDSAIYIQKVHDNTPERRNFYEWLIVSPPPICWWQTTDRLGGWCAWKVWTCYHRMRTTWRHSTNIWCDMVIKLFNNNWIVRYYPSNTIK